jgi:signal transduction histidine kinase
VLVVLVHLAVYPSKPTWAFMYQYYLNLVFMLVYVLVTIFSVRERLKQKDTNARYFFNALIILCIGIFSMFFWESIYAQFGKQLFIETYVLGIMTIVGYFMALSIALTYRYNLFKKQNEQLQLELFKAQEKTSKKIIEALEVERNRIAEDLYDDVGAILSTAIGYLSSVLRRPENKEKFPILGEARKLLDRAIENLRTVSHNLMPKNFAQLGLSKSLTESINKVSQTSSIRFEYLLVGKEQQLEASVEVQIFRIAAELINDVVKNSDATQATMQLIYGEENLTLLIEHDGTIAPVYNNLTSKVDFINGKLEIDTTPSGVTAVVEIPYQYNLVS